MKAKRKLLAPVLLGLTVLAARTDPVDAQYFLAYSGDGYSKKVLESLSIAGKAEDAIDADHRLLTRWFLAFAEQALEDAEKDLPNAAVRRDLVKARSYLEEGLPEKALRGMKSGRDELQRLTIFWSMEAAEAKLAELIELLERDDSAAAAAGIRELAPLVRMDPLQKSLENARARLQEARQEQGKGHGMEAVAAIGEARGSLRRAYLEARLTQVKIAVTHAKLLLQEGKRLRAGWGLRRAARKLKKGGYLATQGEADALANIGRELNEVRKKLSRKDLSAERELKQVEVKIMALLRMIEASAPPDKP